MQKGPSWGPDGRWLRTEAEARRRPVNGGGEMHRSELATSEPTQILRLPTGRMKRPAYLNMTMPPTKVTQSPAPQPVANARRWTSLAAAAALPPPRPSASGAKRSPAARNAAAVRNRAAHPIARPLEPETAAAAGRGERACKRIGESGERMGEEL